MVDFFFEIVKRALEGGEDVVISRFGKFCVKEKGKRPARNLRSGEAITLDARGVVTFKCSGVLRERVNGGGAGQK